YETSQTVTFNVTTSNDELFAASPTVSVDGTFTFEPAANANGTAEVSVTLVDDGGTKNGGEDTSKTQTLFITVEGAAAKLLLLNSSSAGIDGATAQYYDGDSWMDLPGSTDANGELELPAELAGKVKFRMVYNNSIQTVSQNLDSAKTVLFQTVNVTVNLVASIGLPIVGEDAIVEFYQSGWKTIGSAVSGSVSLEMLPNNYRFRMTYANGRDMITQNVGNDASVVFQTVLVNVSLVDSTGAPIASPDSKVLYRGVDWVSLGDLSSGVVYNELLPSTYRFRVNYASATAEIRQNIKSDSEVTFQTKNVRIELNDSDGNPISGAGALVEFNSSGWNNAGEMVDGVLSIELLPKTYNFRMTYQDSTKTKSQNVQFNSTIAFNTVKFTTELRDSLNEFIADASAAVKYYSKGWQDFGSTSEGLVSKELMPNIYNFRIEYASASTDQKNDYFQDTVTFNTEKFTVELRDSSDELFVDADGMVQYNAGGWQDFGTLVDGVATKELLPKVYAFRMNYANASNDKKNDGFDPLMVTFNTSNVVVQLIDSAQFLLEDEFSVEYNSGGWKDFLQNIELLPGNYKFKYADGHSTTYAIKAGYINEID
ncbi:hypothetical protein K8I31_18850, partial [bacterium]|nr:hypothetical protein [bacterium]